MKFCFQISRRLAAYSEGEVSPNDSARIKAHLDGCARCRERSMKTHLRIELMRQLPLLDPADQLWTAIARDGSCAQQPWQPPFLSLPRHFCWPTAPGWRLGIIRES